MRLSYGLAPLAALGNRIVDAQTFAPVLLRGVNRSGLEYCSPEGAGSLAKAGITPEEMDEIVGGWGANIVRLPFNQNWALERPGCDAGPYLAALDQAIDMAARRGAYTLLDLQWLDSSTPRGYDNAGRPNYVPSLPDRASIALWRQLAARYRGEPAVLFDLLNEPHDPLRDDPVPLEAIGEDSDFRPLEDGRLSMEIWQGWARLLIDTIRGENPEALIFVAGLDWAYDLRGHPLPDCEGVVYSTHVYRSKGRDWEGAFGELAASVPVFAGEWGGEEADLGWGRRLADYFDSLEIGWTAWSWSDYPRLVEPPPRPPYLRTPFGALVRERLARTRPPAYT
jgi:endoglucanase